MFSLFVFKYTITLRRLLQISHLNKRHYESKIYVLLLIVSYKLYCISLSLSLSLIDPSFFQLSVLTQQLRQAPNWDV